MRSRKVSPIFSPVKDKMGRVESWEEMVRLGLEEVLKGRERRVDGSFVEGEDMKREEEKKEREVGVGAKVAIVVVVVWILGVRLEGKKGKERVELKRVMDYPLRVSYPLRLRTVLIKIELRK